MGQVTFIQMKLDLTLWPQAGTIYQHSNRYMRVWDKKIME